MEVFLIRLLQFLLAISLLVLLHEGGHLFFSKLFGVRVEKFFMFFDIGIGKWNGSLFQFKPKNSDTKYGIGWLPLGGYCKIAGMIDESFDTEQLKKPAEPWEFRSKPTWQRLFIMIGGVLVNFLLALFIYSMVLFYWGESYVQVKDMSMGMKFNDEAKALGFKDGDILLGTDQHTFKDFNADLYRDLATAKRVDIIRDGKKTSLNLPGNLNLLGMLKVTPRFVSPYLPADIDSVLPGSPAAKLGMRKGDKLLAFGGKSLSSWNEFQDEVGRLRDAMTAAETHKDSLALRTTSVVFLHAGSSHTRIDDGHPDDHPLQLLQAYPERLRIFRKLPGWHQIRRERAQWLCQRPAICVLGRRRKVARRLRIYRQSLSSHMGLAHVLAHDSFPQHHSCVHEHPAYTRSRRWPCALFALRDDNGTQAIGNIYGACRVRWHQHLDPAHGSGKPQ